MKAGLAVIVVNGQETLNMIKYRGDQMKRILSIIIMVLILVTSMTFPVNVFAADIPNTKITSLKGQDATITIKWKKKSNITGYQIQYSINSKFKKENKSIKIKNAKTVSKKITKLKSNKKYYVRIRTYQGKKYSKWSKVKSIKIPKELKCNKDNIQKEEHCTNNNNHSVSCGNMGKWFNTKDEIEEYRNNISNQYCQQYENGEITWDEYMKKSPYGYECWSCGYCGKWTGNLFYR